MRAPLAVNDTPMAGKLRASDVSSPDSKEEDPERLLLLKKWFHEVLR